METFGTSVLSRDQMKKITGGGYRCFCSGAMSNCMTGTSEQVRNACTAHGGENCTTSRC